MQGPILGGWLEKSERRDPHTKLSYKRIHSHIHTDAGEPLLLDYLISTEVGIFE